ncbi:metalloregulator ArsR/SmtB family transcription factor [Bacillus sp. V5-8f]|uniref:helix-turn-helix transcriptional regulator n=1 Tax=Bacillus sp. V5-8f TaxID=2053044 RepID=UPI000C770E65|nr:helix-turn-helix domain-containing protein [Bacillus sp. V5-8f]PLT34721.1 transcriptional regulator [Bacillus sp. V5-8f]
MDQTLKITNVLSDPTRYHIYQYITKNHQDVTVQDIADSFEIHPNVARLHLSKLEDVNMLISETKKTGKGGRPSRLYRLSDEVIQLHFPFRDYQLLSKVAIQTMLSLGEAGKKALYHTGKQFGNELAVKLASSINQPIGNLSFEQRVSILKNAATMAGFYPELHINGDQTKLFFQIFNCPFKEVAAKEPEAVCTMHNAFLSGMFEALFESVEFVEKENMLEGCATCSYHAIVTK